jgi:integrase
MGASPKRLPASSPGTKAPSHLILRNGTWHFRMVVPGHSRTALGGLTEFKASLHTGILRQARILERRCAAQVHLIIQYAIKFQILMEKLTRNQIRELVRSWFAYCLEAYEKDQFLRDTPLSQYDVLMKKNQLENLANIYQEKLAAGDYSIIWYDWLVSLLKEHNLPIPEKNSIDIKILSAEFMKATVELSRLQAKRVDGDFSDSPYYSEHEKIVPELPLVETEITKLSEALRIYTEDKTRTNTWTERTASDFVPKLQFLVDCVGDIPVNGISKDAIRKFKNIIDKLPSRHANSKEFKKYSSQELMSLDIPIGKRMSPSSLRKYYGTINSFLIWLGKNYDGIDGGLTGVLTIKVNQQVDLLKDIFTQEDLKKIFTSDCFKKIDKKQPYKFWVPLLGLYTGMRLEEICQLHIEDIVVQDEIPCIDINENSSDKKLKTSASHRIIPIHPVLIEKFNFLKFVNKQKEAGHARLFPELKKQSGRYSHYVSRWFNANLLVKVGVKTSNSKKTFHSFRHTFANACKMADVEEYKTREFIGHDVPGKSITYGRYGKRYTVRILLEDVLKKITLPC